MCPRTVKRKSASSVIQPKSFEVRGCIFLDSQESHIIRWKDCSNVSRIRVTCSLFGGTITSLHRHHRQRHRQHHPCRHCRRSCGRAYLLSQSVPRHLLCVATIIAPSSVAVAHSSLSRLARTSPTARRPAFGPYVGAYRIFIIFIIIIIIFIIVIILVVIIVTRAGVFVRCASSAPAHQPAVMPSVRKWQHE